MEEIGESGTMQHKKETERAYAESGVEPPPRSAIYYSLCRHVELERVWWRPEREIQGSTDSAVAHNTRLAGHAAVSFEAFSEILISGGYRHPSQQDSLNLLLIYTSITQTVKKCALQPSLPTTHAHARPGGFQSACKS